MNDTTDPGSASGAGLDAQIAQRLFGWKKLHYPPTFWAQWEGPRGDVTESLPAYTTDPAATALVWQWVEAQCDADSMAITFDYHLLTVGCHLTRWNVCDTLGVSGMGATWPEALCRAALALAEALGEEDG